MNYKDIITLDKNERGIFILDPFKGCPYGKQHNKKGCYGICYAAKRAKIYGYDFSKIVKRNFINEEHLSEIISQCKDIEFVRIGGSCEPSYDWSYTLDICDIIKKFTKVVIITKHFKKLNLLQLNRLSGLTINTSVSAIDNKTDIENKLAWYYKLIFHCKSILRIVSFKFNLENRAGRYFNTIQENLFKNKNVIDTVARIDENHFLVKNKIVLTEKVNFMGNSITASVYNKNTYLGYCDTCPDKCGINNA